MAEQEPIKWAELTLVQRNALVAEKVMGWQWIPFDYQDASMTGQLWLLPDGQSVSRLSPGEWVWYLEEEEVYPEGSVFPLEHQDKRILPSWMPFYSISMGAAWLVVEHLRKQEHYLGFYIGCDSRRYECNFSFRNMGSDRDRAPYTHTTQTIMTTPPETICLAALKACGVVIEEQYYE